MFLDLKELKRNVTIAFLDSVIKQPRYSVCIQAFKSLKLSSNQGQIKMQQDRLRNGIAK